MTFQLRRVTGECCNPGLVRRERRADHQPEDGAGSARTEALAERDLVLDQDRDVGASAAEHAVHPADDLVLKPGVRGHVRAGFERDGKMHRGLHGGTHPQVERQPDRIEAGSKVGARCRHRDDERALVLRHARFRP